MRRLTLLLAPAALLAALPVAAVPTAASDPAPVFEPGSHYTATLHQRAGLWRLQPADGQDLAVSVPAGCGDAPAIPQGVWLLQHRGDGLVLAAPSQLSLPDGHAGEVAVLDCGSEPDALHLPGQLLDLLAEHSGAIRVAD